jgi:hypothetical protein
MPLELTQNHNARDHEAIQDWKVSPAAPAETTRDLVPDNPNALVVMQDT